MFSLFQSRRRILHFCATTTAVVSLKNIISIEERMYELLATAAAGLQAGVGLHAAFAPLPTSTTSTSTPTASYHHRTRLLAILLSSASSGCAITAYVQEGHGDLWLVAAVGAALSVPYHILLMAPPKEISSTSTAAAVFGTTAPTNNNPFMKNNRIDSPLHQYEDDEEHLTNVINRGVSTTAPSPHPSPPLHRPSTPQLMYSPSGVLMTPESAAGSWSRKYWFGAALSLTSFSAMMAILASRRDSAAHVAPFWA